jgi:hypothetical protein
VPWAAHAGAAPRGQRGRAPRESRCVRPSVCPTSTPAGLAPRPSARRSHTCARARAPRASAPGLAAASPPPPALPRWPAGGRRQAHGPMQAQAARRQQWCEVLKCWPTKTAPDHARVRLAHISRHYSIWRMCHGAKDRGNHARAAPRRPAARRALIKKSSEPDARMCGDSSTNATAFTSSSWPGMRSTDCGHARSRPQQLAWLWPAGPQASFG